ncbi:MAG TPA: response regulator transcription factor [Chthonomonadaceae bacterium]|nr:response regulator transcription factor [Chthonomonadaceae bacterium]
MPGKLLLVEDDRFILNPLGRLLGLQGYHCTLVVTAEEAWRALESEAFDLMLLDIGLPDLDGVSLCRRIRTKHRLPIIMLTARDAAMDKMIGLEVGADDYITKPFDPQEVVARVRAQLRRSREYSAEAGTKNQIALGRLVVDADAHDAFLDGQPAHLTAREFDLLSLLARHRGRSLERGWLFEQVWGYDAELGIKTLAVTIRRLRCKIEDNPDDPKYLLTVRGYGYKLVGASE